MITFWDVVWPIWIVVGIFGLAGAVAYFCACVTDYREQRKRAQRGYANEKMLAVQANKVLKSAGLVLAVLLLPISIIPAALYFPFKGLRIATIFFKQVLRDRKGV